MNWRKAIHITWSAARGSRLHQLYDSYLELYRDGLPEDVGETAMAALLGHAVAHVPHYSQYSGLPVLEAPLEALRAFPLLGKKTVRERGRDLHSTDLPRRRWYVNTSGGSTGEPLLLVQDLECSDHNRATTMLYRHLLGLDLGQREFWLWGSERDILQGGPRPVRAARRFLKNQVMVSVLQMTEPSMRGILSDLDRRPPRLIVAYSNAIYELARFAERNAIAVRAQNGIVVTGGTLFPLRREVIQRVFGCPVYNQYGSREVGNIACEVPGHQGLWIAPWHCHVEIVDPQGLPVEDGVEGEIVVTSLANFAMPLIRYRIGDRGALMPRGFGPHPLASRSLQSVTGRTGDAFRSRQGTIVSPAYFPPLLYFRTWIREFQVIQKREDQVLFRFVLEGVREVPRGDWEEICSGVRKALGADCRVDFEIVDEIPVMASGKRRYIMSEVTGSEV
jgi:phenylacetate-CoA ligase